jgi:hypothetical protein
VYRRPGKKRNELGAILYEPAALDCLCLTLQDGITSNLCARIFISKLSQGCMITVDRAFVGLYVLKFNNERLAKIVGRFALEANGQLGKIAANSDPKSADVE